MKSAAMGNELNGLGRQFPLIAGERLKGRVYLDSAATMQVPQTVLDAVTHFYTFENGGVHRGVHRYGLASTRIYERARETAAAFLGVDDAQSVIFTAGTTASVNLAAGMLAGRLAPGDEILTTGMEHHSNLLPWRRLAERTGAVLRMIPVCPDTGALDWAAFEAMPLGRVKIAALTQLSNVTGLSPDLPVLCARLRRESGTVILVDGAQGALHCPEMPGRLDWDLYCFSGHKAGAPGGTGVLCVHPPLLDALEPVAYGGGMVYDVTQDSALLYDDVRRFEAGSPNTAGAVGLAAALDFWMGFDRAALCGYENELINMARDGLARFPSIRVLGTREGRGCLSFVGRGGSPLDWARLYDAQGIAVRAGHHCAAPYLKSMGCESAVRLSVAAYNTPEDVQAFLCATEKIVRMMEAVRA